MGIITSLKPLGPTIKTKMDYQSIFTERYQKLNDKQKEAVDAIDGPVLVIAGPGSGKTELLSLRTANILKLTDTPPSSILCLTFTDAAATNMRKRLAGLIGTEAYKVSIHTFHSFGTEVINQNPEYFYKGAHYTPADNLAQISIMEEIFSNFDHDNPLGSYHPEQGYTYLRDVLQRIAELKKAGLNPEEFKKITLENKSFLEKIAPLITETFADRVSKKTIEKTGVLITKIEQESGGSLRTAIIKSLEEAYNSAKTSDSTKPITQWKKDFTEKNAEKETILKDSKKNEKHLALGEIYAQYQKLLHQKGYFDFQDMILDTVKKLEDNPELRFNIQEKYLYVLVDEFQDTSGVQMRLLDNILNTEINENRPNILAVGDDDQSIFKFQGANIDNILGFHKKYQDPKLIVLQKNYRSKQNILDLVRKIILKGEDRLENILPDKITKELKAHQEGDGNIIEKEFQTNFHEMVWIAEEIKNKIENESVSPEEIAIIAPKHRILEEIAKVLDFFNIPVAYERKKDLLEEKHIKEIISIMEFVNTISEKEQPEADEFLPEILAFSFWEIPRVDIWKISTEAAKNKTLWLEVMLNHKNPKIKEIAEFFITIGTESKELTAEEIIDAITGAKEIKIGEEKKYQSPFKDFYFNKDKLKNTQQKYLDLLSSLQSFIQAVRGYKGVESLSIKDIIEFVQLHRKHHISLTFTNFFNSNEKAVNLLTVHKSKGQEFETVFALNCQDNIWIKGKNNNKLSFPINLPLSPDAENIGDMLRLFYVALTRVKSNLYLTHHKYHDSGKEQVKLRFIEETTETAKGIHPQKVKEIQQEFSDEKGLEKLLKLKFEILKHKINTPEENNVLKNLVTNYKLSITHLNNFLNIADSGPQTFLEQNLLRFPQMSSTAAAYGSAMHSALHQFQKAFKKTQTIENIDFLLNEFSKSLTKQRLNKKNYKKLLEKGNKQLPVYYEQRINSFNHNDVSEFDFINQNVAIGNAQITGKIDKLHYKKDTNEILVYDFKTGKPLRDWKGRYDYEKLKAWKGKNQLIFYKLLVENARDFREGSKVNQGFLEFLEPQDNKIKLLSLEITHQDVEQMKKLIRIVYRKITTLDFPDTNHYEKSFYGVQSFIENLTMEI